VSEDVDPSTQSAHDTHDTHDIAGDLIAPLAMTAPVSELAGIGPQTAARFAYLGLRTVGDLLEHLPIRYETEVAEATVTQAKEATAHDVNAVTRTVRGEIQKVRHIPSRRPRIEAILADESGSIRLVWFNAPWLKNKIHPGARGIAQGRAKVRGGYLEMVNPRWEPLIEDDHVTARPGRMRPIYSATEELPSARIERAIVAILQPALRSIVDLIRPEILTLRNLAPLREAYRMVHAPVDANEAERGRRRLAYDELLCLQLAMAMRRWQVHHAMTAQPLALTATIDAKIRSRMPFVLTSAQNQVCAEISTDLAKTIPMNRLLQGDVGSGKTAVAVYAMLTAVAHGHQAVLLAPTEILAAQHLATVEEMLTGSRVRVAGLTGALRTADRAVVLHGLASGDFDIAVGTHALLGDQIQFKSLAVAVIDEQHRFGVEQRAALRTKGASATQVPHTLVMTATPIPRTLALCFFGDLEVSSLRGLLPGRTAPTTRLMPSKRAGEVYGWLKTRIERGEQAFIVVPAIEESDLGLKTVASHAKDLAEGALRGCRIGQLHGQMKSAECEQVMDDFRAGKIDALVATIIVEVGVDIPNATVMIIEHAERFGLAQLHQLRGRVGRGGKHGYCVLIGDPPTDVAQARFDAVAQTTDGFAIAELDLKLRGPGEFFGARQSGLPPLRIADLARDFGLLEDARFDARKWIGEHGHHGDLTDAVDAPLRRRVLDLYGAALGISDIG